MVQTKDNKDLLIKVEFNSGDVLFREREPASALYVIDVGSVLLSKRVHSLTTQLETLTVGDVLGEASLFPDAKYPASAVAMEKTRCLRVAGKQFEEMVRRSPEVAFRFMRKLALRLIHSQFRLSNFTLTAPMARLMHQLLAESARAGDKAAVPVPFDLPEVLCVETGALDDMMRTLIREGLIAMGEEGTFTLPDRAGFERFLTFLELNDRYSRLAPPPH